MTINKCAKWSEDAFTFFNEAPKANFYIIDKNGNYIYKNKTLEEITGDISSDDIKREEAWKWSQKVMETGEEITVEEVAPNGKVYLSKKAPLIIDDKIEGVIGVSIDITEQKNAEQLKIKDRLSTEEVLLNNNRCVKWSAESLNFFDDALDNSMILDIVISLGCKCQNGEGFDELVNAINSEKIRKKIKKVNIVDTTYLYRHIYPQFEKYSDSNLSTEWFLKNKQAINRISVDVSIKSWADGLKSDLFNRWFRQIMKEFDGDEGGNGIVQEFRDLIISDATIAAHKGNGTFEACKKFLLEESAYVCANLQQSNLVYPIRFTPSFVYLIEKYANIRQFCYKISRKAQRSYAKYDTEKVDEEIVSFMKDTVSNVNFFVIDKRGNYICRNKEFSMLGDYANAPELDQKSWENCKEVMQRKEQIIVEEEYQGIHYLSIKAPLIIDNEIEGVIGLAVNITDRKRAERLEIENKLQQLRLKDQEEFKEFVEKISHDIKSPLRSLEEFKDECRNLSVKEHAILRDINEKIQTLAGAILSRREKSLKTTFDSKDRDILVPLLLEESILQKKYEYKGKNIEFEYSFNQKDKFIFIRGNQIDFSSMISNLINNAVEAFEKDFGKVEITLSADNKTVKIGINDTGIGMPQEIVEKLMKGEAVSTTKKGGQGIGSASCKAKLSRDSVVFT